MTQPTGITGIDHVVILARDLARAKAAYERLGFRLTPMGRHTKLDTVNHCIMLKESNYFEVLSIAKPQPLNADFGQILKEREGLAALALKTDDARAAVAKLNAAELAPKDAVDFARPVELAGGTKDARFTVVHIDGTKTPGGRVFLCQHHTPELVWLPDYLEHPNGALGLKRITLVAKDPAEAAGRYAALFGAKPRETEGSLEIATGTALVRVLSPEGFVRAYPGEEAITAHAPVFAVLAIKVASAERAASLVGKAGIAASAIRNGIRIASKDATGTVIELTG